jgi:hypothetical protein
MLLSVDQYEPRLVGRPHKLGQLLSCLTQLTHWCLDPQGRLVPGQGLWLLRTALLLRLHHLGIPKARLDRQALSGVHECCLVYDAGQLDQLLAGRHDEALAGDLCRLHQAPPLLHVVRVAAERDVPHQLEVYQ